MQKINIIIPSRNRAENITTINFVENPIVIVNKNELDLYKERNKNVEIVSYDEDLNTLGDKRNYIMKRFGDVFMMDDDLLGMRRLYVEKGEDAKVDKKSATEIIQNCYECCLDSGAKLFGFNHVVNPMMYTGLKPILSTGYINGCGIGIIKNDKLKFNSEIIGVNDFYISLLNAYYFRYVWKDARFCLMQDSIRKNTGGLSNSRNELQEKKDYLLLKKYFGDSIKLKKSTKFAKNTLKYGRTINLPF